METTLHGGNQMHDWTLSNQESVALIPALAGYSLIPGITH